MKNITDQYQDFLNGKMSRDFFIRNARMSFPQLLSPTTSLEDAVKILKSKRLIFESDNLTNRKSNARKKQLIGETKTNSGHTYSTKEIDVPAIDLVDPYQLKRGVEQELSKMKDLQGDAYKVAIDRALKNLSKDRYYYKSLQIANFEEVSKEDEKLKMREVGKKSKETVKTDSAGYIKKPLKKDESANVSNKKENKEGNPKGVKQMTEKAKTAAGIKKTMKAPGKEQVLNELRDFLQKKSRLSEDLHFEYTMGQQVKTPNGMGEITEIRGGTVSVKLENGIEKDYQINVLNKQKETPEEPVETPEKPVTDLSAAEKEKQERDAFFNRMPDMGDRFERLKRLMEKEDPTKDDVMQKLKEFFSKKKKKKNEAKDAIVAKTPKGNEEVIAIVPSGQGQTQASEYKNKGITTAKVKSYM